MRYHKVCQPADGIHLPFAWIVADVAARNALVASASDLYKFCLQLDDNSVWCLLTAPSKTWFFVTSPSGIPVLGISDITGLTDALTAKAPLASPAFTGTISGGGLGTAAFQNTGAFATAAQGTLATNALPANDSRLTVQAAGTASVRALSNTATSACAGNDARLSDSRTPTSHAHGNVTNAGLVGTTANVPLITGVGGLVQAGSFGTLVNTFCQGNDARLSDARTPTSHASTHNAGGGDALAIDSAAGTGSLRTLSNTATSACAGNDARLSDARTPTSHAHGNITNAGLVGVTANLPLITGVGGVVQASSFGTAVNTFCQGNDSRLSDARTPLAHAHGNITNTGLVGVTANLPLITGTGGVVQASSFGTAANTFCQGNDSRLSDARTPVAHTLDSHTGTLATTKGGTGQTTVQASMNALAGAVTNTQYLRGNGTNVVMSAIQAADVPTLNQNTTGSSGSCTGNALTATTATTAQRIRTVAGGSTAGEIWVV